MSHLRWQSSFYFTHASQFLFCQQFLLDIIHILPQEADTAPELCVTHFSQCALVSSVRNWG